MPNAYCTNLARWLDNLLKQFLPQNFTVKDTFHFIEKLRASNLPGDRHFVSFDVASLFTQIPVDETINFICKFIPSPDLPFKKKTLKSLLELACKNILFSFDDDLYEQFDGMCMGSNLGPTMAAYTMHMVELKYTIKPLFYARYVDDIFAIFHNKEESDTFFEHIQNIHKNIQFTREDEQDGKLTFLDVEVYNNATIDTKWHLKHTNTGTYLHKSANSPNSHKVAAMRSLIYRAHRICSSKELFDNCYFNIESIFINNGYHHTFIEKIKNKVLSKIHTEQKNTEEQTKTHYLTLKYIKEHENKTKQVANEIEKIVGQNNVQIRVAYQTRKTQSFFTNKDKVPADLQSNLVYSYKCDLCQGHRYIGETARHFLTRKTEHVEGDKGPTEITNHLHTAKYKNFSIIIRTKHTTIAESLVYHSVPPALRINKYHPPYQLQLFNCDSYETTVIEEDEL